MFLLWASLLPIATGLGAYLVHRHLVQETERTRPRLRVAVDPACAADAVRLVRLAAAGETELSTDALAGKLERLLRAFPPTEATLQRLSLLQQSLSGTGGEEEFCVVLLLAVAMLCVPKTDRRVTRATSAPRGSRARKGAIESRRGTRSLRTRR